MICGGRCRGKYGGSLHVGIGRACCALLNGYPCRLAIDIGRRSEYPGIGDAISEFFETSVPDQLALADLPWWREIAWGRARGGGGGGGGGGGSSCGCECRARSGRGG